MFVFITRGHLLFFQMDLMAFLIYKMERVATVIVSLPYKAVWRIR